jgi:hypothetical protein
MERCLSKCLTPNKTHKRIKKNYFIVIEKKGYVEHVGLIFGNMNVYVHELFRSSPK